MLYRVLIPIESIPISTHTRMYYMSRRRPRHASTMARRNTELRREIARTAPFARTDTDAEARDD